MSSSRGSSDVEVILVAGGTGRRFGGAVPKQFQPLGGSPMIAVVASRFVGIPEVAGLIVVVADEQRERCSRLLESIELPIRFASAGPERQLSVANGIAALDPGSTLVAVHDAARPLVRPTDVAACIAAARTSGAAILATPVPDTVKRVHDGRIVATVERGDLWLAQTPQIFATDLLRRAHAEAPRGEVLTDDAALVERLGVAVTIVPGHPSNRKITTPEDLAWAESTLAASAS
jgi:2-C-methyl-D-erythritol 4-phosphate cytidylyltransferase